MKKCKLLSMFLFLAIIILPGILWAELSVFMPEIYDEYRADLGENRDKAKIDNPAELLTNGDQLIEFYNDRVPFRSLLIKTEQKLNNSIEKHYQEKISPFFYALAGKKDTQENVGQKEVVDIGNVGFLEQDEPDDSKNDTSVPDDYIDEDDGTVDPDECTHDWTVLSSEESTCTENGSVTYICNLCFKEYTEELDKSEHYKIVLKEVTADYTHYGRTDSICAYCGKKFTDNIVAKFVDESYLAPMTLNSAVLVGRFDWLFYNYKKSFDYYKGTNLPTTKELSDYEGALSLLNLACELRGKKLVVLICPNKEAVYPEYLPTIQVSSEVKRVDVIAEYLANNSTVNYLYPLNELKAMDLYYTTYKKYDTHWNQMGAFIATQTLYSSLGLSTTDPRSLYVEEKKLLDGDLFAIAGIDPSSYDPETRSDIEYYIEYKSGVNITSHTEGDYNILPVYRTESNNATYGEKFIMIGDSFRTRMIPYIQKDFTTAVFAHRDNVEEVAADFADAKYVILSAVERDESKIIETALKMAEIISRYP